MASKNVLVTGSLAFDYIMDYPGVFSDHIDTANIHSINLSFLVDSFKKQKGGTAGNIAFSLSLLKIQCGILASAGSDFGDYKAFLKKSGVITSSIKTYPKLNTAGAMIMTDKKDNQITAFSPGAMEKCEKLKIKNLKSKPSFVVIAPANPNSMAELAVECQNLSIPYMFDPGMQLPRITDSQLINGINSATILISNDYEINIVLKRLKLKIEDLLKKVEILIVTLGEKGSIIYQGGQKIEVKSAKPKAVIDPTGAGDAYRAGFLAGFMRNFDFLTSGQMGSQAASYAIEKYGTINHHFTIEEFNGRFFKNYGKRLNL